VAEGLIDYDDTRIRVVDLSRCGDRQGVLSVLDNVLERVFN